VALRNDGRHLDVRVTDDGRGVPAGFNLDEATGLGLSIVRTLVTTELGGTIAMTPASPADAEIAGLDPVRPGALVDLRVPLESS
jgi:two-component sensor histidine kinase